MIFFKLSFQSFSDLVRTKFFQISASTIDNMYSDNSLSDQCHVNKRTSLRPIHSSSYGRLGIQHMGCVIPARAFVTVTS
jgi:hypothetical protein